MAKKKDTTPENTQQGATGNGISPDAATGTQQGAVGAGDNAQGATGDAAGNTPTPDAGTDTGNAALKKIGKEALKRNPSMSVVYVTTDGTAFGAKNDAENHAKALGDNGVVEVTK